MPTVIKIDDLTLNFRSRKGCEEITNEFIDYLKKHPNGVRRALFDMKNFLDVTPPRTLRVTVVHIIRIEGLMGAEPVGEVAGVFYDLSSRIELNARAFDLFKANSFDPEAAHWSMMQTFLHEVAHFAAKNEEEAEELANEWLLAI